MDDPRFRAGDIGTDFMEYFLARNGRGVVRARKGAKTAKQNRYWFPLLSLRLCVSGLLAFRSCCLPNSSLIIPDFSMTT